MNKVITQTESAINTDMFEIAKELKRKLIIHQAIAKLEAEKLHLEFLLSETKKLQHEINFANKKELDYVFKVCNLSKDMDFYKTTLQYYDWGIDYLREKL